MAKAAAADQKKLLDLQALDTKLVQLHHRARVATENPQIKAQQEKLDAAHAEMVSVQTESEDVARQVKRAEQDVEVVVTRIDRDQKRLDTGAGTSKDLTALQSELASLAKRRSDLEDAELEAMESLEAVQAKVETARAAQQECTAAMEELTGARDAELTSVESEAGAVRAQREEFAAGIDQALVARYDKIRTDRGGIGAGALQHKRCGACRMELNPSDLAQIARAAEDDVVRCEECGRILVRTAESGL